LIPVHELVREAAIRKPGRNEGAIREIGAASSGGQAGCGWLKRE
jgi:hypothetical protein